MTFLKQLSLKWQFLVGSLFYLRYAPYSFVYSRRRDQLEREVEVPTSPHQFSHPGKLLDAQPTAQGATFRFEQVELEVHFLAVDLVRLDWKLDTPPISYAISDYEWTAITTQLQEEANGWSVFPWNLTNSDAPAIIVCVHSDGSILFKDAVGHILRQELPPQHNEVGWIHQAQLRQEERIYGLGERTAPLNLRKVHKNTKDKAAKRADREEIASYRMWNFDAAGKYDIGADPLYISIPIYLGLHLEGSYLTFYENSFPATFTFSDVATAAFEGGMLRYYVTTGTPSQMLQTYTKLTGRSPLPARWTLGYHQSRWGYHNEEVIREVVKEFKARDLPLSAIHLDIDCQVHYRAFTIDPKRFPKLASFTKELDAEGVKFVTILNPGVKYSRKSKLFLEGEILGAFCRSHNGNLVIGPVWPGWSVFPDFTNPLVRRWWSRQYEYLLDVGVAGFWHDMNEPAAFILWGDRSLPARSTKHFMEGRGGDHREAHNIYGLLQAQAGYESLRQYRPDHRPFIVSRAGWAGLQRYAWTWTGDIECTWTALRQTIATVIGLGLSGIPFSGPDIGGFQGNPSAELYLRWFQLSTFLPFYRTHSANNVEHRNPWTYGEPTLSIIREFLKLRYRLIPYFYTLAWECQQTGHPLVRPLFWSEPNNAALWDEDDAFCLGDALLVCPVIVEGGRSRLVNLPIGDWYDFWQDNLLHGASSVEMTAPLERIPLMVKVGSILPMEENKQLVLHLYPTREGKCWGQLYEDAGDGQGSHRVDNFYFSPEGSDRWQLICQSQGDYPFSYQGIKIYLHGFTVGQVWVDGMEVQPQGENYWQCSQFQEIYISGHLVAYEVPSLSLSIS